MQLSKLSPLLNLDNPVEKQILISTINALIDGSTVGILFEPQVKEPPKKDGLLVFADGTKWDPGSGKGLYVYQTNKWWKVFY